MKDAVVNGLAFSFLVMLALAVIQEPKADICRGDVRGLMTRHQLWQFHENGVIEEADNIWQALMESDWDHAFFPGGVYKFQNEIELTRQIQLNGIKNATEFQFPNDTNGLIGAAPFQTITGISFKGSLGNSGANGVTFKRPFLLMDCKVWNFSGNGIDLETIGVFPDPLDSRHFSNLFGIINCRSLTNKGHGFYADGADSNAGYVLGLDSSSNDGWGIFDSSFLGNYFYGCHTATNGIGGYKFEGLSQRSTAVGCYSESDNTNEFEAGSLIVGGLMAGGNDGALYMDGNRWKGSVSIWGTNDLRLNLRQYENDYFRLTHPEDHPRGLSIEWDDLRKGYAYQHADVDARTSMFWKTDQTPWNRASASVPTGGLVLFGYGLGQKMHVNAGSSRPTWEGSHGDMIYNDDPDPGEFTGWRYNSTHGWLGFGKIEDMP